MPACSSCSKAISKKSTGLSCAGTCGGFFHARCVDIPPSALAALTLPGSSWRCTDCRYSGNTSILTVTDPEPTPGGALGDSSSSTPSTNHETLMVICNQLQALNEKYATLCNRFTDYEKLISDLQSRCTEVESLREENRELRQRVNALEQHSRLSNLEIQGVPETSNENAAAIVQKIGTAIGLELSPADVDVAHRVQSQLTTAIAGARRPRNIIVRFLSRQIRNKFLAASKVAKKRAPAAPGFEVPGVSEKIFVNEHLSPENKRLLKLTRDAARSKGFKYHWVSQGTIFVRRNDKSRAVPIKSTSDLDKLDDN